VVAARTPAPDCVSEFEEKPNAANLAKRSKPTAAELRARLSGFARKLPRTDLRVDATKFVDIALHRRCECKAEIR
jgi:hypothetical protein